MKNSNTALTPADIADGALTGQELEEWLAANPNLAEEVELTRKVRQLLQMLHEAEFVVPAGFEERVMERIREDRTFLDLLDLGLSGIGRTILELLALIFGLLPQPQPSV
jgi:hypothetical protein